MGSRPNNMFLLDILSGTSITFTRSLAGNLIEHSGAWRCTVAAVRSAGATDLEGLGEEDTVLLAEYVGDGKKVLVEGGCVPDADFVQHGEIEVVALTLVERRQLRTVRMVYIERMRRQSKLPKESFVNGECSRCHSVSRPPSLFAPPQLGGRAAVLLYRSPALDAIAEWCPPRPLNYSLSQPRRAWRLASARQ